ncbi:MAG: T9SS type A sorting domain-containing protein [Prevotella sp.]
MKQILIILLFCLTEISSYSQSRTVSVFYDYDNAGNCVLRKTSGLMRNISEFDIKDTLKVDVIPSQYIETEISINVNKNKDVHYMLSDVGGHVKAEGTIENGLVTVNVFGFSRGLYLLRVYDGEDAVEHKLIKR